MSGKQLKFDEEARQALLRGTAQVAAAVRPTLGPRGRSVVIDRKYGSPQVTTDGATIVRDIELPDHFENMGGQLLAEASRKANDRAGDGTTTAALLAEALVEEGMRNLAGGSSAMGLKRGIDLATKRVLEELTKLSRPLQGRDDIAHVATISSGSHEIGEMIADAMDKVTADGVITVEESSGIETEVEVVEGMQFDRGWVSPYLVTDQKSMEAILENPFILITPRKISAVKDVVPALELAVGAGRQLLIVAEDIDGEALATLVVNKLRGTASACAIKAPGFGDRRLAMLQDLAVLTGAEVVSEELGLTLEGVEVRQLGSARRVVVTKEDTTFVEGRGDQAQLKARVKEIERQIDDTDSDWDREKLQERKARLVGGVAVVRVGAPTETALKERKERFEDALDATRAAVAEGILPGGGRSLLQVRGALAGLGADDDERAGVEIVRRALEVPMRQLAANAGVEGSIVCEKVSQMGPNEGFDVDTLSYRDLYAAG
ncbi:MAG: chaperonin GroEL, partial [Candidatus Dormibacteria bacterium]